MIVSRKMDGNQGWGENRQDNSSYLYVVNNSGNQSHSLPYHNSDGKAFQAYDHDQVQGKIENTVSTTGQYITDSSNILVMADVHDSESGRDFVSAGRLDTGTCVVLNTVHENQNGVQDLNAQSFENVSSQRTFDVGEDGQRMTNFYGQGIVSFDESGVRVCGNNQTYFKPIPRGDNSSVNVIQEPSYEMCESARSVQRNCEYILLPNQNVSSFTGDQPMNFCLAENRMTSTMVIENINNTNNSIPVDLVTEKRRSFAKTTDHILLSKSPEMSTAGGDQFASAIAREVEPKISGSVPTSSKAQESSGIPNYNVFNPPSVKKCSSNSTQVLEEKTAVLCNNSEQNLKSPVKQTNEASPHVHQTDKEIKKRQNVIEDCANTELRMTTQSPSGDVRMITQSGDGHVSLITRSVQGNLSLITKSNNGCLSLITKSPEGSFSLISKAASGEYKLINDSSRSSEQVKCCDSLMAELTNSGVAMTKDYLGKSKLDQIHLDVSTSISTSCCQGDASSVILNRSVQVLNKSLENDRDIVENPDFGSQTLNPTGVDQTLEPIAEGHTLEPVVEGQSDSIAEVHTFEPMVEDPVIESNIHELPDDHNENVNIVKEQISTVVKTEVADILEELTNTPGEAKVKLEVDNPARRKLRSKRNNPKTTKSKRSSNIDKQKKILRAKNKRISQFVTFVERPHSANEDSDYVSPVLDEDDNDQDWKLPVKRKKIILKVNSKATSKQADVKKEKSQPTMRTCHICNKEILKKMLRKHFLDSHGLEKPYICDCGKAFKSSHLLDAHSKRVHKKVLQCESCERVFVDKTTLKKHKLTHVDMNLPCQYCGKTFISEWKRNLHIKNCHEGDKLKCPQCDKAFANKSRLKVHMQIHEGKRDHLCPKCGKTFISNSYLAVHTHVYHGNKSVSHTCEECGKEFDMKSEYRAHLKTHNERKNHECQICGAYFSHPANCARHMRTHTDARPYICEVCGKGFKHNNDRKRHSIIHTGTKPFRCDQCGKTFNQMVNLQTHMRSHENSKRFWCPKCGVGYGHMCSLKAHMKKHEGSAESKQETKQKYHEQRLQQVPSSEDNHNVNVNVIQAVASVQPPINF